MDHSYFIHKVLSDEALILRIKQGDWGAYAVFCERHRTVCTSQPTTCCMMTRMPEMPHKSCCYGLAGHRTNRSDG